MLDHLGVALGDGPRDLPERQRSMTATLVWSLDLVGARERDLLQRLSILPGTFSLAAAESVFEGAAAPEPRRLVEHSLVARSGDVRGAARFRLPWGPSPARRRAVARIHARGGDHRTDRARAAAGHAALGGPEGRGGRHRSRRPGGRLRQIRIAYHRLVDEARHDAAAGSAWRLWIFLTQRGTPARGWRGCTGSTACRWGTGRGSTGRSRGAGGRPPPPPAAAAAAGADTAPRPTWTGSRHMR